MQICILHEVFILHAHTSYFLQFKPNNVIFSTQQRIWKRKLDNACYNHFDNIQFPFRGWSLRFPSNPQSPDNQIFHSMYAFSPGTYGGSNCLSYSFSPGTYGGSNCLSYSLPIYLKNFQFPYPRRNSMIYLIFFNYYPIVYVVFILKFPN